MAGATNGEYARIAKEWARMPTTIANPSKRKKAREMNAQRGKSVNESQEEKKLEHQGTKMGGRNRMTGDMEGSEENANEKGKNKWKY